ncbi:hypothetical protein LLEC1_02479 [Akanthomyces lecanii]|uniref:Uncharacterized protein n=1 Tax=Cordyceps confragosa TaxID=2714763 RepID=A0A179I8U5_CORDF|nr:hypothetical protein LLEC1_02479 [Akanthomyces lecanii]
MADDLSPTTAARPSLRHGKSGGGNKADGNNPTTTTTTAATATSTGIAAPPGYALRRAKTAAETSTRRLSSDSSAFESPHRQPRRSSNFSDYGVNEARSILNPHGKAAQGNNAAGEHGSELSSLAGLSLAFALLPAIAGALFKNGSAVTTDIMLLGLAGVFLHWSVTQPWLWYHSAQQVRIEHEENAADEVFGDDDEDGGGDDDDDEEYADGASHLDDVPEEATPPREEAATDNDTTTASVKKQSALSELYLHEVMALVSCFSLPLISAFILHMIRSQLSRPSEGLVSNYNLTIFILVSEVRVLSHMIKLVQARTLHLQRVVHSSSNPFGTLPTTNSLRINAMLERLDALESESAPLRSTASSNVVPEGDEETAKAAHEAVLTRDVRNAIQPELDALNRAVRRYEKKSTLLQSHVDAHFAAVDARVEDAIALAAVAAKNSNRGSILVRAFDALVALVLLPFSTALHLLLLPVRWLLSRTSSSRGTHSSKKRNTGAHSGSNGGARAGGAKAAARGSRGSKTAGQPRYNGDKMPSRLSRK